MTKEKTTSHAAQSLVAREKAQAGLHSEFIGLGAGGGKGFAQSLDGAIAGFGFSGSGVRPSRAIAPITRSAVSLGSTSGHM